MFVPMECWVCGRVGSVVLTEGPLRVEHYWGECDLPPRVPTEAVAKRAVKTRHATAWLSRAA